MTFRLRPPLPQSHAACSYDAWCNTFAKDAIPGAYLPLGDDFVRYLREDGIVLPRPDVEAHRLPVGDPRYRAKRTEKMRGGKNESKRREGDDDEDAKSSSSSSSSWDELDEDEMMTKDGTASEVPCFPAVEAFVLKTLTRFREGVFPKLNFTAPLDASFMLLSGNGRIKCTSPGEVYLLMKSSDFIHHDLSEELRGTSSCGDSGGERTTTTTPLRPILVLKKWIEDLGMEYRVFVREGSVVFVVQRDAGRFFPELQDFSVREVALREIDAFHERTVKGRFPLSSYMMDIFMRKSDGRVIIVDFAPFPRMLPGTSEGDELHGEEEEEEEVAAPHSLVSWYEVFSAALVGDDDSRDVTRRFRYVESRARVDHSSRAAVTLNKVPLEFVNGKLTQEDFHKGFERLRMKARDEHEEGSDDDDDERL